MHYRISERLEFGDGRSGSRWAQRRPKALVGALMGIHGRRDGRIERIGRGQVNAAIIGQRRVDRQRARGDMAGKAIQPVFGDEIEQGRDRDQVFCAVERRCEIAAEIERNGIQPDIVAEFSAARHRQQA